MLTAWSPSDAIAFNDGHNDKLAVAIAVPAICYTLRHGDVLTSTPPNSSIYEKKWGRSEVVFATDEDFHYYLDNLWEWKVCGARRNKNRPARRMPQTGSPKEKINLSRIF